ncbi:hypothetical protein ACIBTV_30130 [Micromonospora sp. NPDC049366]|uniref:hypothetical protein n=1 Tax=Micromonospora sp. NPDC049366 TaxID=3364271 RepID=UPI0037A137A8
MGLAGYRAFGGVTADLLSVARQVYEPLLAPMRLGRDDIAAQDLDALEASLARINEVIANPSAFGGPLNLKLTAGTGVVVAQSPAEAHVVVGPLPILLERKQDILDRLAQLRPQRHLDNLREVVAEKVADPSVREDLLTALERESDQQKAMSEELDKELEQVKRAESEAQARLKVEILERRSRVYKSFLERESVATLVGGLLLVSLTVALLVAMFAKLPVSEIVSSAFLIILGYFFGQSTSRRGDQGGNSDAT